MATLKPLDVLAQPNFDPHELQKLVLQEIYCVSEVLKERFLDPSFNAHAFDEDLAMLLALSDFYKVLTPVVNEERRGFTIEEMQRIAKHFQLRADRITCHELRKMVNQVQEKTRIKQSHYYKQEGCKEG